MRPPANRKARLSHEFDDYFPGVDRNDLQALNGLCLEWRVDLEPNICAQEAMIKAMQAAAGFEQPPAIVPGSVGPCCAPRSADSKSCLCGPSPALLLTASSRRILAGHVHRPQSQMPRLEQRLSLVTMTRRLRMAAMGTLMRISGSRVCVCSVVCPVLFTPGLTPSPNLASGQPCTNSNSSFQQPTV